MDDTMMDYRGTIRGLDAFGSTLVFTTEHEEGQSTAIQRLDLKKQKGTTNALDCGVTAQLLVGDTLWFAGTDNRLNHGKLGGATFKHQSLDPPMDDRVVDLASVADGVVAVGGSFAVVGNGKERLVFDLEEPARSVASDPTGQWFVVGTTRGHIVVFHNDGKGFEEVSRTRLHDGEVTALMFAPDELRVYSTGTDCRLLVSFVRGAADTEDRGGSNMHEREVQAMILGPDFVTSEGSNPRFFTAGLDSTLKSWPRGRTGSQRPAGQANGVVQTSHLALVEIDGKPHLAAAGSVDNTIRIFELDAEGRVGERVALIADAYSLCGNHLTRNKPKEREAALANLASYADTRSLQMLAEHISHGETDHKLQVKGVELLTAVDHRRTASHLESFFNHGISDVRTAAFVGLRKVRGADDIEPLRRAIGTGAEDLGLHALAAAKALGTAAAVELVRDALDHDELFVRRAALETLESLHGDTPQGTLLGLRAGRADVRRAALSHVLSRNLLNDASVRAQLRGLWDDDDDRVRLWAFVVATHRQPNLVKALRGLDDDYHRQVFELEELPKDEKKRRKDVPKAAAFEAKKLKEEDFRPLLEAMGSRAIDVSLRGARGLAALGDERSFGTLLQLSREADSGSRVAVCKALGVLGDPRSIKRIRAMLHDADDQVRDAAFTALSALLPDEPLTAAKAGLAVDATDVRERALALLIKTAKKQKKSLSSEARELLHTALNDSAASLRSEAFKSVLNLAPDGAGAPTLRFILQSVHADIRNEVLQEAKKPKDADLRAIVLTVIDDADAGNRREALDYALDKWPSAEHRAAFSAALSSTHVSQRVAAVSKLSEQKGDIRALLVEALDDNETDVRLAAVRALVQAENRKLLANAVSSEHLDVRVEAASALAVLGDARSLAPLLEVLAGWTALLDKKANSDDIEAYKPRLQSALMGLVHLGHPDSIDAVLPLLDGDANIAANAATTLPAIAHPSNLDKVRAVADHENANVRLLASLALTYNGDATHAHGVFGQTDAYFQLFAALGLRNDSSERLLSFVDNSDARVRNVALALALSLELTEHAADGIPERSLALLSAQNPFIRLSAAEALEHYGDQPAFYKWVYAMLNGLSSPADAWTTEPAKLLTLSRAVTLGEPRLAVRAGQILAQLLEPKADEFERQFGLFEDRFKDTLADLEKQANAKKTAPVTERIAKAWRRVKAKAKSIAVEPTTFDEALHALAFGAYIGLARQHNEWAARLAALDGLRRLAPANDRFRADAISVVLLMLGDPNQPVRERAFDVLKELGADDELLSTEALTTGHSDMGLRGLELLAGDAKSGNALLERTLVESTNGLENQAAKLLVDRIGQVAVYRIGLGAASVDFRTNSVRGLSRESAAHKDALQALRGALESSHDDVRFLAARELAKKKEAAAFDTLVDMVQSEDHSLQSHAVTALQQLRDERAPNVLLDRVDDDPDETADVETLLEAAVSFSDPTIAPRLIKFIDDDKHRSEAFDAALELSGYSQYQWVDDDEVTPKWEEALEPLHPDVFAQLLDLAYRIGDQDMLGTLVGMAKWPATSADVDRTLGSLLSFSNENVRHRAVEIVGWRARYRQGPVDGLKEALTGRDPLDQLYSAEGLALAGHADGLTVLRTAVDALDDFDLRERAVLAIGVLADPTTLDMLLAMANDNAHDMHNPAIQAIGHMSQSDRADEIFAIFKHEVAKFAWDYDIIEHVLKGLRWFGTPGAWQLLRDQALGDENWWIEQKAVELLRFDEGSRDVVAAVLRKHDDWDVAQSAVESLRHLWGPDSLEPDYLIVQACVEGLDEAEEAFKRLREQGDIARILELMPKVHEDNVDDYVPQLVAIVLGRDPLPVAEATAMLEVDEASTAAVAAQIVGRAGPDAAKAHGKALVAATKKTRVAWLAIWSDFLANKRGARDKLTDLGGAYRRLVWACGQLQVGKDELLAAANLPDHELAISIREDAVSTLGEKWFGKDGVTALVKLARGGDARLRSMAATELDRCSPAESAKLLGESIHDDVSFGRLLASMPAKDAQKPLRDAVREAAGIALPRLAAIGDIDGLLAAMRNANLTDETRRGAIDALGTFGSSDVADSLAKFGADDKQDEMLRKAAWRARRRVTRSIASQEAT